MTMIGMIMGFAGSQDRIPEDWLPCDGRALPRTGTYAALFAAIGTLHGRGDGATTFNLPDFRGYFLRGVSGSSGVDKGFATRVPPPGGPASEAGSLQHAATARPATAFRTSAVDDHQHGDPTWNGLSGPYELATENRGPGGCDYGAQSAPTTGAGGHSHSIIEGGDEETRPINKYVHWVIQVL